MKKTLDKQLTEKEMNNLTIGLIQGKISPEEYAEKALTEYGAGFNFEKMLGKYKSR